MLKTKVTDLLGVQYPLLIGTFGYQSNAEFVAAAANAGTFACLASAMFKTGDELREEIRKTRSLTDKPFGVNINLFPTMKPVCNEEYIDISQEEGIKVIETAGRSPEALVSRIKQGEVKLMHKCARVRDAVTAQRIGADIVEVVGFEAGGHPGKDQIGGLVLIPLAANALDIPLVAGGGIGDGRGLVAVLSLGADGALMGTMFMATREYPVHDNIKKRLISARETDTMITFHSKDDPTRALRSELAEQVNDMERRGATLNEVVGVIGGGKGKAALANGDTEQTLMACGQVVGMIDDIPTVKELVDRIINEAIAVEQRLSNIFEA